MNKLKFKKFGWDIVEDETKINIYDYFKNKLIITLILIVSLMTITIISIPVSATILLVCGTYLVVLSLIYIIFSFSLIKHKLLLIYFLIVMMPLFFFYLFIVKILIIGNEHSLALIVTIIYVGVSILYFVIPKKYNKKEDKKVQTNKLIPLIAVFTFLIVDLTVDIIPVIIIFIIVNIIETYTYHEIKYVLKNNTEYNNEIKK